MIISLYVNKTLIYLLIYCAFKVLFYISASSFFSSFLPILYLISISKLFSFLLYKFQNKITKKIQSIESNDNINRQENIIEQRLVEQPENININNRELYLYQLRKKIISLILILCASILEVIFYASFNKMFENDSVGSKRAFYYLTNNKLFFLLVLAFLYLVFYKTNNNTHNILSLFLIFFSQIIIYIIKYEEIENNYTLLIYGFFMNIIYSSQNFIEKELNGEEQNIQISPMFIMGKEGIFELILVIIFNIGVKWYYGENPIDRSLIGASITVKCIFMMLCILLSEYIRIDTLNNYDPFYVCFYEEIIYIFFSIYYFPSKELSYLLFHIIIMFSFFVFIETIELNFCGLNHNTQRYLREREFGILNEILEGIANISSLSTGSHSDSSGDYFNRNNDLIINEDNINFEINTSNDLNLIIGKIEKENSGEFNEEDKNKIQIEDDEKNINIGKILDEDVESFDGDQKTVFSNHLIN